MKAYKIRDKETGLFSKGGTSSNLWGKTGKTWGNIGHVKNHLHGHNSKYQNYPYENAEIVEIEINYDECYSYPVNQLMEEIRLKKEEQERKWEENRIRWQRERELKQLEELEAKYR